MAYRDELVHGSILQSGTSTYEVLCFLGQGAFGKVIKCRRTDKNGHQRIVALKTMNRDDARREINMLQKIKRLDHSSLFIHWEQAFSLNGDACLEFELLQQTLHSVMEARRFKPLSLTSIRPIIHQLASGLCHLKEAQILHSDLKLDNVMLVDHQKQPFRIKIIDFGLALEACEAEQGTTLQCLANRAPEIILGLPYTEAIDVWSVGNMAVYMFLGEFLYPGSNEYNLLRFITDTQGPIPQFMLESGWKTANYFHQDEDGLWELKTPELFCLETGAMFLDTRMIELSCLDDLLHYGAYLQDPADQAAQRSDLQMFVDLIKKMLQLDPSKRITPHEVLEHTFMSMEHLQAHSTTSTYAKTCIQIATLPWIAQTTQQRPPLPSTGQKRKRDASNDGKDGNSSPAPHPKRPRVLATRKRKRDEADHGGDDGNQSPAPKRMKTDGPSHRAGDTSPAQPPNQGITRKKKTDGNCKKSKKRTDKQPEKQKKKKKTTKKAAACPAMEGGRTEPHQEPKQENTRTENLPSSPSSLPTLIHIAPPKPAPNPTHVYYLPPIQPPIQPPTHPVMPPLVYYPSFMPPSQHPTCLIMPPHVYYPSIIPPIQRPTRPIMPPHVYYPSIVPPIQRPTYPIMPPPFYYPSINPTIPPLSHVVMPPPVNNPSVNPTFRPPSPAIMPPLVREPSSNPR